MTPLKPNILYSIFTIHLTQKGFLRLTKRSITSLLILTTLFFGTGLIYLFNPFTKSAQAAWFNDDWSYRQEVPITANTGVDTNTYISFTLDTATLITAGKVQSACQDIRVTDVGGNILPYHVGRTNACNNAATTIDALVASLGAGASTFYVYYGNPSVASQDAGAFSQSEAASYTLGSLSSETVGTTPLLYYKLDDAQGTAPKDSTTNANNGVITAGSGSWQTEDQCMASKCYFFDGAATLITGSKIVKSIKSVSFWVRPNTIASQGLLNLDGGTHIVSTNGSGVISATGFTSPTYYINGISTATPTLVLNQWSHITITTGTGFDSTNSFTIGKDGTNFIKGRVDEVKFYNYALSASQVKANYIARGNSEGAATVLGASSNQPGALSNGLVGYWKMEESSWTSDCSTAEVLDASGNGNNGTSCPNADANDPLVGKFGSAGDFDGTNDYVQTTSNTLKTADNFSISTWFKADSGNFGQMLIWEGMASVGGWGASFVEQEMHLAIGDFSNQGNTNRISFFLGDVEPNNDTDILSAVGDFSSTSSSWNHVVVVVSNMSVSPTLTMYLNGSLIATDTGTTTRTSRTNWDTNLKLGRPGAAQRFYNGRLDETRIYNKSLSSQEVSQLYNFAPGPVGYWKFNDKSGTTAFDISGNGNNASFSDTPLWVSGKYGGGLKFDGVNDYVQTASNIPVGTTATISMWVNFPSLPGSVKNFAGSLGNSIYGFWIAADNSLKACFGEGVGVGCNTGGSATSTISANTWYYITMTADGTNATVYLNGIRMGSHTEGTNSGDKTVFGSGSFGGVTYANVIIDEPIIYNYARTQGQIIEDMNGGHPAPGSPVGTPIVHYRFEEGAVNRCSGGSNDTCNSGSGGSTYDGAFSGNTSYSNSGKIGKAVSFDGTDDYVDMGDLSVTESASQISWSFWINHSSTIATSTCILCKYNNDNTQTGWAMEAGLIGGSNNLLLAIPTTSSDANTYGYTGNNVIPDNTWTHVTGVFDGTQTGNSSRLKIYINGISQSLTYNGTIPAATVATTSNARIGTTTDGLRDFSGSIDELKVYNIALTPEQINLDMNQGKSQVLGALGNNSNYAINAANQEYCVPGDSTSCAAPVGRWDFEEGSGTNANDSSGNGNTGTITAGTGSYSRGKDSKGYLFDKAATVITAGSGTTIDDIFDGGGTVEAWIYPKSIGEAASGGRIFGKVDSGNNNGWLATLTGASGNTSKINFNYNWSGSNPQWTSTNTVINFNQWNHVAITYNASGTSNDPTIYINGISVAAPEANAPTGTRNSDAAQTLYMGNDVNIARTFDGMLDHVMLFDYTRTAAQIAWDYNHGAPVGHWRLDDCQGTTAIDSSGNGNSGTVTVLTGNPAGTCTTSSSFWGGASGNSTTNSGKRNYAPTFDGTDDYVSLGTPTQLSFLSTDFSVCAWAYPTSTTGYQAIINKGNGTTAAGSQWELESSDNGDGKFSFNVFVSTNNNPTRDTTAHSTSVWYHVCGTRSGNTNSLYVNGILKNSVSYGGPLNDAGSVAIGAAGDGTPLQYAGQIDDVRVYNYALTTTQLKNIMNEGAVRFGPSSGAP